MYADDHNDYFPMGWWRGGTSTAWLGDWSLFIGNYVSKSATKYENGPSGHTEETSTSRVFRCPAYHDPTAKNATSGYRLSYSCNLFYMPCDGTDPWTSSSDPLKTYAKKLRKRGSVKRAGEIILIGDGSVVWDGSHSIYNADAYYDPVLSKLNFLTAYDSTDAAYDATHKL